MFETIVSVVEQALVLLILLKIILSYFLDPFHPIRQSIDRLIEPLLKPIRDIVPSFGRFDFSPVILMILVQLLAFGLRSIF